VSLDSCWRLVRCADDVVGPVVHESDNDKVRLCLCELGERHADLTQGGHFAAYERPDVIVSDLQAMFGKSGQCYKIVPGKSGY
jgi:hypothetical protein